MARPRISPALFAALTTLLVRVAVALSRIDELELELYSGSLAWALLEGMPLHPDQLPVIEHNRGSVVVNSCYRGFRRLYLQNSNVDVLLLLLRPP